jgi:hypothetical protein
MDKKKDDLLARIEAARKRRAAQGITSQQLDKIHNHGSKVGNHTNGRKKSAVKTIATKRPHKIVKNNKQLASHVFISGGIGDVFAVESHLTEDERKTITTIFYGTQKADPIIKLFTALPNYTRLKQQSQIWSDFSRFWCFYTLNECVTRIITAGRGCPESLKESRDLGIMPRFSDIKSGRMKYTGSSFLKHKLTDISRFNLPQKYIAVCPYSTDKRVGDRDFNGSDWVACLEILDLMGMKGVILNKGSDNPFITPQLVNLGNNTEITEAVEILKGASGYIGIDSSLSVLAAQLFVEPNLLIKSRNQHLYSNMDCYYAPHKSFDFVKREIRVPEALRSKLK